MKKLTLTTIAILAALTLSACGNTTNEPTTSSSTITSSEIKKAHSLASQEEALVDEVYASSSEEETYSSEETSTSKETTSNKVVVPSSLEWFAVKTQAASGFVTRVRCENCDEPMQLGSANMVYGMTQVQTKNGYSTIKVINYNQKSNNIVEFYLNTNEPALLQGIAQQFIQYMTNLKPDGNLDNGMASNAQYWLEHDGLEQDIDE